MLCLLNDLPRVDEYGNPFTVMEFGCGCPYLACDIASLGYLVRCYDLCGVIDAIAKLLVGLPNDHVLRSLWFESCNGFKQSPTLPADVKLIAAFDTTGFYLCGQNVLKSVANSTDLQVVVTQKQWNTDNVMQQGGFDLVSTASYGYFSTESCNKTWTAYRRYIINTFTIL